MNSLPVAQQCTETEAEILLTLYECKRKKYHTTVPVPKFMSGKHISQTARRIGKIANSTPQSGLLMSTPGLLSTPGSITTPDFPKGDSKGSMKSDNQKEEEMSVEPIENPVIARLQDSLDLAVSEAERLYYNCDYQQCHTLTELILKQDPYHYDCLPIHISCEVELKQSNSKFFFIV